MKYINKTIKERTVHPNAVRALLKNNGYKVGRYTQSRISGWGSFIGDIEVKENWKDCSVVSEKVCEGLWKRITTEEVNVSVIIHNVSLDINEIKDLLEKNELLVKIENDQILTVDKI